MKEIWTHLFFFCIICPTLPQWLCWHSSALVGFACAMHTMSKELQLGGGGFPGFPFGRAHARGGGEGKLQRKGFLGHCAKGLSVNEPSGRGGWIVTHILRTSGIMHSHAP